jgi:hypothetical protein
MSGDGKNLRLLGQEAAPWRQTDILEEIAALQVEVAKGNEVYSTDDLRYLERKLAALDDALKVLTAGG